MSWLSRISHKIDELKSKLSRFIEEELDTSVFLELTPEREEEMLNGLADQIVKLKIETPAILFLETVKPISYVGSQTGLLMIAPFLEFFGIRGYEYTALFQKRENIERLLKKIESRI